jgi:hypothetical protein
MAETRGLRISLNLILAELVAYLKVKDRLVLGLVLLRLFLAFRVSLLAKVGANGCNTLGRTFTARIQKKLPHPRPELVSGDLYASLLKKMLQSPAPPLR